MENFDFLTVQDSLLPQQPSEEEINRFKILFKKYLIGVKNREKVLSNLYNLILRFQTLSPKIPFLTDPEKEQLNKDAENFLKKNFPNEVLNIYSKEITVTKRRQVFHKNEEKPWVSVIAAAAIMFDVERERTRKKLSYKINFLNLLNNCLFNFGLHPDILNRNPLVFKRYNIIIENDFKTGNKKSLEIKTLINNEKLLKEYISPYENKLHIKINGKLIPFKNLIKIKITSSLLLDDEIELFMFRNNLTWTNEFNSQYSFANLCTDETDDLLNNPYLIDLEKGAYSRINFVDPNRINELRKIKSKKFDFTRLIQLCEELNNSSSSNKNLISPSLIARAIIDHVPPIFGQKNFSEVANNYSGATKSFKKSMFNLDKSLRNIADGNIHTQIRDKEVLPTLLQIDFTHDLDLLLSEIVRILK